MVGKVRYGMVTVTTVAANSPNFSPGRSATAFSS